jgi:hypothetical protein
MGRTLCSIKEAAGRLDRTYRMVNKYIRDGFLTRYVENGKTFLDKQQVEELAVDLACDAPKLNRRTILQLQIDVQRLQADVEKLQRNAKQRSAVLHISPVEARGFYDGACESLFRKGKWSSDEVVLWAGQFERLDEISVETLCKAVQDTKAWKPFYDLCVGMMKQCETKKAEAPDADWGKLYDILNNGRCKIREAVNFLVELGKGSSTDGLLGLPKDPKEAILANLKS